MGEAPAGRRPLLRRRRRAPGAALTLNAAADWRLTRSSSASQDAAAGHARAEGGDGEAAIPASKARAPAVATIIVLAALCCVSAARGDNAPPTVTSPTSTTPEAPPPDPYHPPAPASKPKPSPTVVRSAPAHSAPVQTYTPPAPVVPVRTVQPQRTVRQRSAKAAQKRKARVVHRRVMAKPKPKPVKVTFNPFANIVAASSVLGTTDDTNDRDRYLWLAGIAFAVLALAGLSLQVLALRTVER
jgi:hypothetical protein